MYERVLTELFGQLDAPTGQQLLLLVFVFTAVIQHILYFLFEAPSCCINNEQNNLQLTLLLFISLPLEGVDFWDIIRVSLFRFLDRMIM